MLQLKDTAIVLRVIPYQDRHQIITALTEHHGQVTAMAKNSISSRRFGGSLAPFVASEWLFTEKPGAEILYLQEAVVKRSFEGLRSDFERLSMASVFSELMLRIAPKASPARSSSGCTRTRSRLSRSSRATGAELSLLNGYLAKVLQWSGSQPQLQACLGCGTPVDALEPQLALSCVVADAGWVCENCRGSHTHHVQGRGGGFGDSAAARDAGGDPGFLLQPHGADPAGAFARRRLQARASGALQVPRGALRLPCAGLRPAADQGPALSFLRIQSAASRNESAMNEASFGASVFSVASPEPVRTSIEARHPAFSPAWMSECLSPIM